MLKKFLHSSCANFKFQKNFKLVNYFSINQFKFNDKVSDNLDAFLNPSKKKYPVKKEIFSSIANYKHKINNQGLLNAVNIVKGKYFFNV